MNDKLSLRDYDYFILCCAIGSLAAGFLGYYTGEFYSGTEITASVPYDFSVPGAIIAGISGVALGIYFAKAMRRIRGEAIGFIITSGVVKGILCGIISAVITHLIFIVIRSILLGFDGEDFTVGLIALGFGFGIGAVAGVGVGLVLALLAIAFDYNHKNVEAGSSELPGFNGDSLKMHPVNDSV